MYMYIYIYVCICCVYMLYISMFGVTLEQCNTNGTLKQNLVKFKYTQVIN